MLSDLPEEILDIIASHDHNTFYILCLTIKWYSTFKRHRLEQKRFKELFTRILTFTNYNTFKSFINEKFNSKTCISKFVNGMKQYPYWNSSYVFDHNIKYIFRGLSKVHVHMLCGKIHNLKGPAVCVYTDSYVHYYTEIYFENNRIHNYNGPALVQYDTHSNPLQYHYFINGDFLNLNKDNYVVKCKELGARSTEIKKYYLINGLLIRGKKKGKKDNYFGNRSKAIEPYYRNTLDHNTGHSGSGSLW